MAEMNVAGGGCRSLVKVVRVETADEFVRVTCETGLLVPVEFAAKWREVSPQALYDRIRRGTLTKYVVCGQVMVCLAQSKPLGNWTSSQLGRR